MRYRADSAPAVAVSDHSPPPCHPLSPAAPAPRLLNSQPSTRNQELPTPSTHYRLLTTDYWLPTTDRRPRPPSSFSPQPL